MLSQREGSLSLGAEKREQLFLGGTGGGTAGEVTPELGLDNFASGRKSRESILG